MLQVFCCEPESIIGTLIESPELMDLLFSFLQTPKPLDCTLAGYWARVLQILLVKRSGDVYGFCRSEFLYTARRRGPYAEAPAAPLGLRTNHCRSTARGCACLRLQGAGRYCLVERCNPCVSGMHVFAADGVCRCRAGLEAVLAMLHTCRVLCNCREG